MKKIIALSLTGIMMLTPAAVFADDADLEARIAALEERVAALEEQLGTQTSEDVVTDDNGGDVFIEYEGCTLKYKDFAIKTDYEGDEGIILYFDFYNGSEETTNYTMTFDVSVFQNGKEMELTDFPDDPASHARYTDLRANSGPIDVGACFKLEDKTDIIVSMETMFGDAEPVEFTLPIE